LNWLLVDDKVCKKRTGYETSKLSSSMMGVGNSGTRNFSFFSEK
jgi:hypothetical protein